MKTKLFLLLIFLFIVGSKIFSILNHQNFNLKDDTALCWTESALQYRTAKVIATHGFMPALDTRTQHPEGLAMKNRLTVLMEVVSGYTYRFLIPKAVPFHVFLVIFVSFFSSLSVFPLYLSIHLVCRQRTGALLGAALYGVTPAVYTTVTAPGFELQDFALPLLFFHLYLFAHAIKSADYLSYAYAFLSASFLFAALTSWHLTQFYYIIFVLFIIFCFLFIQNFDMRPFYVLTGMSVLAGILIPTLRSMGFILSFSMLLSYALVVSSIVPKRKRKQRQLLLLCLCVAAVCFTMYISRISIPEYRFVYGLVLDKMRYLGTRPADPTTLSWETLVMWVSPFTSPSFKTLLVSIGALFIPGIIGLLISIRTFVLKKMTTLGSLFLFMTVVFFPLYLLLMRLDAFLIWFLSLQSGVLPQKKKKIVYLILLACIFINGFLLFSYSRKCVSPDQNYLLEMIKYIRYNTPKEAPILTTFAYGPSISTYTGRPILLHPKFEAEHITNKIKEFEHRLFMDESMFYSYCKSYHAQYFIYQTDILLARGPESIRYRTHNLTASESCVAFELHFHPHSLTFFELVYSNPHYRVYRILEHSEQPQHDTKDYLRVYDEQLFDLENFGIN